MEFHVLLERTRHWAGRRGPAPMLRVSLLVAAQLCVCAAWRPVAFRAPARPAAPCSSAAAARHVAPISMLSGGGGAGGGNDFPFSGDNMAGRGDLAGGRDAERNAQVSALKRAFYTGEDSAEVSSIPADEMVGEKTPIGSTRPVSLLGVLRDMPLCRWEMNMLPFYNNVLNVWQPMYTHLFETVIAQKQPWYYVHLQTPGGTKNLMNPDYALDVPASKAPRVGTLMRVVSAERTADSRLTCVVQGLARVRVIEQTQKEPYARATVQLVPDDELSRACYPLANALLKGSSADVSDSGGGGGAADWWVHTVAHAAAVSTELEWLEYEAAPVAMRDGSVSQLVPFSSEAGLENKVAGKLAACQKDAVLEAASLAAAVQARADHVSVTGAPVLSTTDLSLSGVLGGGLSGASLDAWSGWEEGAEGQLGVMERRTWIEIDLLIRNLRRLQERSKRLQDQGMAEAETGVCVSVSVCVCVCVCVCVHACMHCLYVRGITFHICACV